VALLLRLLLGLRRRLGLLRQHCARERHCKPMVAALAAARRV